MSPRRVDMPAAAELEPVTAKHLVQIEHVALHKSDLLEGAEVVRPRPAGFDDFEAAPPRGSLLAPEPAADFAAALNGALGALELLVDDVLRLGPMLDLDHGFRSRWRASSQASSSPASMRIAARPAPRRTAGNEPLLTLR